jgi:hypothetical protein
MLWRHYVFRRGPDVHMTWDLMFERRPMRLLYIVGKGFDLRAQTVMRALVENLRESRPRIERARLLGVSLTGYELAEELRAQTENNGRALAGIFKEIGDSVDITVGSSASGEDDMSASTALRVGTERVLSHITDETDIILDVSSMPRVVYLALLTGILNKLVGDRQAPHALFANGVNFQILVAEDATLDAIIRSEDPSNDLVLIPGFSGALHAESFQDWPLVWFPILGEGKRNQLEKVMALAIPPNAEICPVLPHPSRDPRRADRLLIEYKQPLIDARGTPTANILLAHEAHPFEAYRQLLKAMRRYRDSMRVMGGCRLVVTPLASKLITLGAALACFEIRPADMTADYGIAIPYAEPTRYVVSLEELRRSKPELSTLVLTGDAYEERDSPPA